MKPPLFDYYAPRSLDEAVELLGRYGQDAKILAGGQSLVPLLNMRLVSPKVLIDLNRVRDLAYLRREDGVVAIGAMTRDVEVEEAEWLRQSCPLLMEAVGLIGHPAIRNRGTVGGSIAHADPAAELPAVLSALGGAVRVRGPGGVREIAAGEFFLTYLTTAVHPDELVSEIRLPVLPDGSGWAFEEVARRHGDFAIVGVAAYLTLNQGRIDEVGLALTGVGGVPVRARTAEAVLKGAEPAPEVFHAASGKVQEAVDPDSDLHASADYRRHLAGLLTTRALERAAARAGNGGSARTRQGG